MQRLHHLPFSPFCRKIRLVLAEKKIEVQLTEERPWDRKMDFILKNPAIKVPVLEIDGLTLSDSGAIFEYLEETRPNPPLLPNTPGTRAEARRICAWFDDKFHKEVIENLLYERMYKKIYASGQPNSSKVTAGTKAIKYHIDYFGWLADERRWLAGEQMTIADLTAAAHFSCLDYSGLVDWDRSAPLKEWYARIKSRPSFRPLLEDTVTGLPPEAHYADLDF